MAAEWATKPIEDCMSAIIDYRGKTPKKTSFGVSLITAKIVKGGRIETPAEFISFDDYAPWMRRGIPEAGDVVITTEAPLGEVAQLGPERVALAQRLIALRGKPGVIDNGFLKFLMQSEDVQDQLRARSSGTTVLGIKQSELRKVMLTLPPIPTQQAIAHILGTLDDKIELNRKMNETLEGIARAIFKSWFVDFDPVRAKAVGRDTGLPKEIADLFPDSFEGSELGVVPEGWTVKHLPDAIAVNPSRSLTKGAVAPYLDMGNMPTTSAHPAAWVDRSFTSGMKFINGDTLVARITPCLENGKTAFVDFLNAGQVGWGSTEYIVLHPKPPLPPEFAYFMARTDEFRNFAISNMSGTSGRQRVPVDCFDQFRTVVPAKPVAEAFGRFAYHFLTKARTNNVQSQTLATIRDALLPKLISGQIAIKDAERFIGRAA